MVWHWHDGRHIDVIKRKTRGVRLDLQRDSSECADGIHFRQGAGPRCSARRSHASSRSKTLRGAHGVLLARQATTPSTGGRRTHSRANLRGFCCAVHILLAPPRNAAPPWRASRAALRPRRPSSQPRAVTVSCPALAPRRCRRARSVCLATALLCFHAAAAQSSRAPSSSRSLMLWHSKTSLNSTCPPVRSCSPAAQQSGPPSSTC